jgi:hypothetical protein
MNVKIMLYHVLRDILAAFDGIFLGRFEREKAMLLLIEYSRETVMR